MPELPEVETMRRGVLPIVGAIIKSARRTPCAKRPIEISPRIDRLNKRLEGKKIVSVDRLGKRVVVVIENGDRLILEPRMTGLVLIDQPPTREHLRFQLKLRNCPVDELLFWDRRGLGNVTLLSEKEYNAKLDGGTLGPDALVITAEQLRQRLESSSRAIKVALLDQSVVLGVGNIYASELLHYAGVHPGTPCNQIATKKWPLIHQRMLDILLSAIQHEGSTLSDGTYRTAVNDPGNYQNEHAVYDRSEQRCVSCHRGTIRRIVQAQRATFYCPVCQPEGRTMRKKK